MNELNVNTMKILENRLLSKKILKPFYFDSFYEKE